jgi:hypothetical protein
MSEAIDRWISECKRKRFFWIHSGAKEEPHLLLPDRRHAGMWFDRAAVVADSAFLQIGGHHLVMALLEAGLDIREPQHVVSIGPESHTIAHVVALSINNKRTTPAGEDRCTSEWIPTPWVHEERRGAPRTTRVSRDKRVLVVTTEFDLDSVETAVEAVRAVHAQPVKLIGALANFSSTKQIFGGFLVVRPFPVVALLEYEASPYEAESCILCEIGSKAMPEAEFYKSRCAGMW